MTQPDDRPIRWGILATGGIAHAFARDLALQPDCEVVAVGSRSQASADAFGDEFGVPHRHASYQALVNDPDVDAVYVSTPHPGHHDAALLAINAGKAVLVEKPFAMDAAQAREMIDAARDQGTFLMEAMWTRFLPHIARVREILAARTLGEWIDMQHPPHGNVLNCRDDGCMAGGHPAWWSGRGAVPLGLCMTTILTRWKSSGGRSSSPASGSGRSLVTGPGSACGGCAAAGVI